MKKILLLVLPLFISSVVLAGSASNDPFSGSVDVKQQGIRPVSCCLVKHNINSSLDNGQDYTPGDIAGPYNLLVGFTGDLSTYDGRVASCPMRGAYYPSHEWAGVCTINTIMTIADWIMWFAGILTVVVVMLAGILYMTSGGSPEQIKKAVNLLKYGLIGIGIAIGARLIPALFKYFIGI